MQRLALARRHLNNSNQDPVSPTGPARDYRALWQDAVKRIRVQKMEGHLAANTNRGRVFLLLGNFSFVILFYTIIIHTIPVSELAESTAGINAFVNNMVTYKKADGSEGNLESVATLDDMVNYSESLVRALLTTWSYRGARQPDEELMLLRVHRLLNTIVFTQRRVAPSDCSYEKMKPLYEKCYEGLDSGNEITEGKQTLKSGVVVPYNDNMGGFGVPLKLHQETALEEIAELREGMYWDRATREFAVLFAFHNSPGHYTGSVSVAFTLSPFGQVASSVDAQFLRMRPYSEQVNGVFFLNLQLAGLFVFLLMFGWYLYTVFSQPHVRWMLAKVLHPWSILELVITVMLFLVIFSWLDYLQDPMRTSFNFQSDEYQNVVPLAAKFGELIFLMAAALLLMTVRSIEYFAEIKIEKMQKISRIIEAIMSSLSYFMAIFALLFIGFVLAAHVLFGPVEPRFNGIVPSSQTLSLWFVALSGGQRAMMEMNGGTFFLVFFIGIMMILLFNMFIAIVMAAHDEVMDAEEDPWAQPFNHYLADKICDALGVSKFRSDPYHKEQYETFQYHAFTSAARRVMSPRHWDTGQPGMPRGFGSPHGGSNPSAADPFGMPSDDKGGP